MALLCITNHCHDRKIGLAASYHRVLLFQCSRSTLFLRNSLCFSRSFLKSIAFLSVRTSLTLRTRAWLGVLHLFFGQERKMGQVQTRLAHHIHAVFLSFFPLSLFLFIPSLRFLHILIIQLKWLKTYGAMKKSH